MAESDWTGKMPGQVITNTGKVSFWIGKGESRREVKPGETTELLPGDIEYKIAASMGER